MELSGCFFDLCLLLLGIESSTSSDLDPEERKSNSSSEDSAIFLASSLRLAPSLLFLASLLAVTNVVLPKLSQSFPEPSFALGGTKGSTGSIFNRGSQVANIATAGR